MKPDQCHACGYPMSGLEPGSICPECGEPEPRRRVEVGIGPHLLLVAYCASVIAVGGLLTMRLISAYQDYALYDWEKQQLRILGVGLGVLLIGGFLAYRRRKYFVFWPTPVLVACSILLLIASLVLAAGSQAIAIRY